MGRPAALAVATVPQFPWWGVVSSLLAPVLFIGGWIVAAALQPVPFDAISRSISSLAAQGMPYRWLLTGVLLAVGTCDVLTGLALRSAATAGRVLLIIGGLCGMLVAAFPQPQHGSSHLHQVFATAGVVLLTIWPVAAMRRDPSAPAGLRPPACYAAAAVTCVLLLWFCAELLGGQQLGLAERVVTGVQAMWPLAVVITVLTGRRAPLTRQRGP